MAAAKVFMSGRSQAVRLPKEFRVTGNELSITQVGKSLVLTPLDADWEDFFSVLQHFESDKPVERHQPNEQQPRDAFTDT